MQGIRRDSEGDEQTELDNETLSFKFGSGVNRDVVMAASLIGSTSSATSARLVMHSKKDHVQCCRNLALGSLSPVACQTRG